MSAATRSGRVILSTLNATYLHTSLALRSLQAFSRPRTTWTIGVMEFTINQKPSDILAELYLQQPAVLAFSCYIWNIEPVLKLCNDYKKADPTTVIILGGPEVSSDPGRILEQNPGVDYVVSGEGETVWAQLLAALDGQLELESIPGIAYRGHQHQINFNPPREALVRLDDLPFAYAHDRDDLTKRVVYYESSRGCPFRCSYCLSASSAGVRTLSLERVKSDLDVLLTLPVREIKFVDRTFNLDERRARVIMEYILSAPGQVKAHFEINAGLFSDAMLDFLAMVPPGRFNFEIGIQSTYPPALQAVNRQQDWGRLRRNISRLTATGNIHIHLDLIAGLPGEDLANFKKSLDMVYELKPHMLQLGFLKILKGSPLEQECSRLGYVFQSHPPYQVISTPVLDFGDVLTLTRMESLLDKYYNSGEMAAALDYIITRIYEGRAADFFQELAGYWTVQGWWNRGHQKEALYSRLGSFVGHHHPSHQSQVDERLKYDYLLHNHRYSLPEGLTSHNPVDINQVIYGYTRDKDFVHRYLPGLAGRPPREIKKLLHIEYFRCPDQGGIARELKLMFVYDPITRAAIQVLDLSGEIPCAWDRHKLENIL
ncbi:MAG: B12-binding domain-containing radical SAM protein [Syntrophomonadaceae bacterium]